MSNINALSSFINQYNSMRYRYSDSTTMTKTEDTKPANTNAPPTSFEVSSTPGRGALKTVDIDDVDHFTIVRIMSAIAHNYASNGNSLQGLDINLDNVTIKDENEIVIPIHIKGGTQDRLNNLYKSLDFPYGNDDKVKFVYVNDNENVDTYA